MFCVKCGKEIPQNGKFCMYCGEQIQDFEEKETEIQVDNSNITTKIAGIILLNIFKFSFIFSSVFDIFFRYILSLQFLLVKPFLL